MTLWLESNLPGKTIAPSVISGLCKQIDPDVPYDNTHYWEKSLQFHPKSLKNGNFTYKVCRLICASALI
ncbi:hypothetical protein L2E82_31582 [Cichorium intybus]|uniref:Uncharacterized protein n=1 Tax=Cichorium intybus TaxID=13427 RepID=A0ACB9BF56_CICIN|nr:hypothetical protein L2E82_31582 [Cichorium intybus]